MKPPPLAELDWNPTYRLVASRFPPVSLFDSVANEDELETVFAIQGLTNPRLRQELGRLDLVPKEERLFGHGTTPVMAAFCYLNPQGSRFSDGTFGVYYAASSLAVAVSEVSFHRTNFMAATAQPAIGIDMRSYVAKIQKPLHTLEGQAWASMLHPSSYTASQDLARQLQASQSYGIAYPSVRDPAGQCIAVFRPTAIAVPVRQGVHVTLQWNGKAINRWYTKSGLQTR